MKRFFCTVCKRIRRTRRWPINIERRAQDKPGDAIRTGECDAHYAHRSEMPAYRKVAR